MFTRATGEEHMANKDDIQIRIEFHRTAVEKLREAYIALVDGGVSAYTIGSRSLTRLDITKIMDEIKGHENAIDELEEKLKGGKSRKAYGVIPRDW